ncbi:MAG: hypothetical protein V1929_11120 [bacterium]
MTTQPSARSILFKTILVLGIVALAAAWWWRHEDLAQTRQELEQLTRQDRAPGQVPASDNARHEMPDPTQPAPSGPAPEPEQPQAPVVSAESTAEVAPARQPAQPPKPAEELVMTPTGRAPAPRAGGLTLAGTHVAPVEGGLSTTMQFNPTTTKPIGLVAIVVRLPADGDSKILDLVPVGSMKFKDVAGRVSEDGKFAVFQGTPESVAALEFALSVSGPAVADVRGTTGIGAFSLRVGPTGAEVTPK